MDVRRIDISMFFYRRARGRQSSLVRRENAARAIEKDCLQPGRSRLGAVPEVNSKFQTSNNVVVTASPGIRRVNTISLSFLNLVVITDLSCNRYLASQPFGPFLRAFNEYSTPALFFSPFLSNYFPPLNPIQLSDCTVVVK